MAKDEPRDSISCDDAVTMSDGEEELLPGPEFGLRTPRAIEKGRVLRKRWMIAAICVCLVGSGVLLAAGVGLGTKFAGDGQAAAAAAVPAPPASPAVCTSNDCVRAAAFMGSAMDRTADPCDNFYQYACGGYIASHDIPESSSRWGTFSEVYDRNERTLKNILEKGIQPESRRSLWNQVKVFNYYDACMNTTGINALGKQPVAPFLAPLDEAATVPQLLAAMGRLARSGFDFLFSSYVDGDAKDPTMNAYYLSQGGLGLPTREYYLDAANADALHAYRLAIQGALATFGASPADAEKEADDIVTFETELAQASLPAAALRDPDATYNKMSLGVLARDAGLVDFFGDSGLGVSSDHDAVVATPAFFTALGATLAQTTAYDLRAYAKWRVVYMSLSLLGDEYRSLLNNLRLAVSGITSEAPRWKTCVARADADLGWMLGRLFVDAAFSGDSRAIAEEMIRGIKTSFKSTLGTLEWMTAETKRAAADKADEVVDKIGYPDLVMSPADLDNYYKDVAVSPATFYANHRSAAKRDMLEMIGRIGKPSDKTLWSMTPPTVNAYYSPVENTINFPAGILQPPFFASGYPKAMNYGGIGAVMGHELTHGFDDEGRQYDGSGQLRSWWDAASIAGFASRAACVEKQYSSYALGADHVNGNLTMGENIADNGGLKEAYSAYREWVSTNGEEPSLPGLGLTNDKIFFVNFAQVWCGMTRPEDAHMLILKDPHSPPVYRVLGALSNNNDFARTFSCAAGTTYNPKDKCTVW